MNVRELMNDHGVNPVVLLAQREHGAGKSRQPADKNVCSTSYLETL
jgi:hypothetical protein